MIEDADRKGIETEEQEIDLDEQKEEIKRKFDPEKATVVRNELFADIKNAFITIRNGNITFNAACLRSLPDVVYVNLVIDEENKMIGVRECDPNDKHAIRWCVAKGDTRKSRKLTCPDFTNPLYDLMGWDKKCRYKVRGFKIDYGESGLYIVFDLKVSKIFQEKPKKGEEPVDENGNIIETPIDRKGYFPDDIAHTFGVPVEEARKEAERMNMDVFVPANEFAGAAKEPTTPGNQASELQPETQQEPESQQTADEVKPVGQAE